METISIRRAKEAITVCATSNTVAYLQGGPGIGKTEAAVQVADELFAEDNGFTVDNLGKLHGPDGEPTSERPYLRTVILSQREPSDLLGLPSEHPDKPGVIRWLRPDDMPFEGNDCAERGILFLDEIAQCVEMMQAPARQMLTERRFGPHRLKDGWTIVAAGNRVSDRAGARPLLTHTKSAIVTLDVAPDVEEWCAWASTHGVSSLVIGFIRFRPELLYAFNPDAPSFPCPRTWAMLSRIVDAQPSSAVEVPLWGGCIGDGAAAEFAAFVRHWRALPSIESILKNPTKAGVPAEMAARYAVASALSRKAERANMDAVITYLNRLPVEFAVFSLTDAIRRDNSLARTAAFVEWGRKNQTIAL